MIENLLFGLVALVNLAFILWFLRLRRHVPFLGGDKLEKILNVACVGIIMFNIYGFISNLWIAFGG
jgi:hypothetical protein